MIPTTDLPCCENCPTIKCFHHPNHWKTASQCWSRNDHIQVWEFTKEHGAACHPGARAYLNKDVIAELIKRRNNTSDQVDWVYRDCIALLRGNVK